MITAVLMFGRLYPHWTGARVSADPRRGGSDWQGSGPDDAQCEDSQTGGSEEEDFHSVPPVHQNTSVQPWSGQAAEGEQRATDVFIWMETCCGNNSLKVLQERILIQSIQRLRDRKIIKHKVSLIGERAFFTVVQMFGLGEVLLTDSHD